MKRFMICAALACTTFAASAQENESATTSKFALEEGQWAIGISANPFLEYVGNMFNGNTSNTAPTFGSSSRIQGVSGGVIFGKYMLSESSALRARLLLDFTRTVNTEVVADDHRTQFDPIVPDATTLDNYLIKKSGMGLAVGYERRKGTGRLQGVYGGELGLAFSKTSEEYTYGNPMTAGNAAPTSGFGVNSAARPLSTNGSLRFGCGVNAFGGVELFLMPGLALGGELTLGIGFETAGTSESTYQTVENGVVVERSKRSGEVGATITRSGYIGLTTNVGGNLYLAFYF